MFITVIAFDKMHGAKPLKLNGIIKLVKEPDNKYDPEAIACEMRHYGKIGYVANSVHSVIKGCMSSGRVYDKIDDEYFAKIKFITGNKNCTRFFYFFTEHIIGIVPYLMTTAYKFTHHI